MKHTAGSLMLWVCFFCWRSWTSCWNAWHHGFYQIPTDTKSNPSVRNLIMGHVWIFHQDNNPKSLSTKLIFTMAVPVLWPEPCRKWVGWRGEVLTWSWVSKNLERFWMKEWSLISCQVFSKLFRHYMRKLRAVILGKGHCNNWVPIIVANIN